MKDCIKNIKLAMSNNTHFFISAIPSLLLVNFLLISCVNPTHQETTIEPVGILVLDEEESSEINDLYEEDIKDENEEKSTLPAFDQFVENIKNGETKKIVGLWVEKKLALIVIYQPKNNPAFVSSIENVATFFLMPYEYAGNHGLLAHNYLAGRFFFDVEVGDIVQLVYGDGNYLDFEVVKN